MEAEMANTDNKISLREIIIISIPVLIAVLEATKVVLTKIDKKDDTNKKLPNKS